MRLLVYSNRTPHSDVSLPSDLSLPQQMCHPPPCTVRRGGCTVAENFLVLVATSVCCGVLSLFLPPRVISTRTAHLVKNMDLVVPLVGSRFSCVHDICHQIVRGGFVLRFVFWRHQLTKVDTPEEKEKTCCLLWFLCGRFTQRRAELCSHRCCLQEEFRI